MNGNLQIIPSHAAKSIRSNCPRTLFFAKLEHSLQFLPKICLIGLDQEKELSNPPSSLA